MKLFSLNKRVAFLLLFFIIGLGAFLRFSTIDAREVWYDEAYTGLLVHHSWSGMFEIIAQDVHPPLYYIITKLWTGLVGITDFSLRTPSAFFGVLLIPLAFLFTRALYKKDEYLIPLAAAFMIAVNPFLIAYSQEARPYALVAVLTTLAGYFFVTALHDSSLKWNRNWIFFSLAIGAAFLSHYLTSLGILTFFALWFFFARRHDEWEKMSLMQKCKNHLPTLLPAALLFALWLPQLVNQLRLAGAMLWIPKAQFSFIFRSAYAFLFGVDSHALGVPPVTPLTNLFAPTDIGLFVIILVTALTVGLFMDGPTEQRKRILLIMTLWALPIIGIILLSFAGVQWYVERYMLAYGVYFLIALCVLLGDYRKRLLIAVVALYTLSLCLLPPSPVNPGYRELAEQLKTTTTETRIVTDDPFDFFVLRYYLIDEQQRITIYDETGSVGGWDMVSTEQIITSQDGLQPTDIVIEHSPLRIK